MSARRPALIAVSLGLGFLVAFLAMRDTVGRLHESGVASAPTTSSAPVDDDFSVGTFQQTATAPPDLEQIPDRPLTRAQAPKGVRTVKSTEVTETTDGSFHSVQTSDDTGSFNGRPRTSSGVRQPRKPRKPGEAADVCHLPTMC